jgi:hypothetical protein
MANKRSKGVTFCCWFFIISSALGFLTFVDVKFVQQEIKSFGVGYSLYIFLSCVAYLICGIYLLKLRETARKAVIILGLLSIISIPLYLEPTSKLFNTDNYVFVAALLIIPEAMFIYFFTRQKVKEQFKKEAGPTQQNVH